MSNTPLFITIINAHCTKTFGAGWVSSPNPTMGRTNKIIENYKWCFNAYSCTLWMWLEDTDVMSRSSTWGRAIDLMNEEYSIREYANVGLYIVKSRLVIYIAELYISFTATGGCRLYSAPHCPSAVLSCYYFIIRSWYATGCVTCNVTCY